MTKILPGVQGVRLAGWSLCGGDDEDDDDDDDDYEDDEDGDGDDGSLQDDVLLLLKVFRATHVTDINQQHCAEKTLI